MMRSFCIHVGAVGSQNGQWSPRPAARKFIKTTTPHLATRWEHTKRHSDSNMIIRPMCTYMKCPRWCIRDDARGARAGGCTRRSLSEPRSRTEVHDGGLVREPYPVNPCGRHNTNTTPSRIRGDARSSSGGAEGPPGVAASAPARAGIAPLYGLQSKGVGIGCCGSMVVLDGDTRSSDERGAETGVRSLAGRVFVCAPFIHRTRCVSRPAARARRWRAPQMGNVPETMMMHPVATLGNAAVGHDAAWGSRWEDFRTFTGVAAEVN